MSDGSSYLGNSAVDGSTVGIQAGVVHDSTVNIVHPDASPEEKARVGMRFLADGVPSRARDMLGDAIAHGYDTAEVRCHWVLATLSGRALHDLGDEEFQRLHQASGLVPAYAEGEWKDALRIVFELLATPGSPDGDVGNTLERLRALPPRQRDDILHHLDLVLTGKVKDSLWAESRERAENTRLGNNRTQRVWAYFEPDPVGPRAIPPRPSNAAAALAAFPRPAALFVILAAFLWVLALVAHPTAAVLSLLVALMAALTAARFGRSWWYEVHRSKAMHRQSHLPASNHQPRLGTGFTNRVRHSFDHYFANRVPYGFTPDAWLQLTGHLRNSLVAEIAFLYRESRISVERIHWLIRFLAEEARERFNTGTLSDHSGPDRTPATDKALCVIGLVGLGLATSFLLVTAASGGGAERLLLGGVALAGAVWSGHTAASRWLEAEGEERRLAEETAEYQERLAARRLAYQRWKTFLEATRPSELDMETWLTCDKTLFVDEALRHYQLDWRDLVTHTVLVTPARPYRRARVKGGPWRYSRYSLRLFLVTQDGVREVSTELDFSRATRGNEQRSNYRFDALCSVQVRERSQVGCDLELVLTNGPARNIRVRDADTCHLTPEENAEDIAEDIAEVDVDAAGLVHTFRLLEGIAADGKGWIKRRDPHNLPSFHASDQSAGTESRNGHDRPRGPHREQTAAGRVRPHQGRAADPDRIP